MIKPSEELLSEMLIRDVSKISINGNELEYCHYNGTIAEKINIFELMFLMKKFVSCGVWSGRSNSIRDLRYFCVLDIPYSPRFEDDNSEFEAVTKACEWKLNERI